MPSLLSRREMSDAEVANQRKIEVEIFWREKIKLTCRLSLNDFFDFFLQNRNVPGWFAQEVPFFVAEEMIWLDEFLHLAPLGPNSRQAYSLMWKLPT